MRKLLNVPYYSQHIDVKNVHWQERACGILSLKMVLDFMGANTPRVDEFINIGVESNAHGQWGWIHEGLVAVAKKYGIKLTREEFRTKDANKTLELLNNGISKIVFSIEQDKPVLISAIKKWVEVSKFHMMVIVGFEMNEGLVKGIYYHDPDAFSMEEGMNKFVTIQTFKKHWRRMAIFAQF